MKVGFNKMLRLTVQLENCIQCHHSVVDYNPLFDKFICGHPDADICVNIIKGIHNGNCGQNRLVDKKIIPNWCPLKNGYKY